MNKYFLKRDKQDERDHKFNMAISPVSNLKLPVSVDLRSKCPVVYNQSTLGSCSANAGCAARLMAMGNTQIELSRLFLYYMERSLENTINEDSGASMRDICKALTNYGVCEEKYMPYDVNKFTTNPSEDAIKNALNYKIASYKSLNSAMEVKQNLAIRQQPVLMGMTVFQSFESPNIAKTGKMSMPIIGEKEIGGHAVLIVGYNDGNIISNLTNIITNSSIPKGCFVIRNSWGSDWGDKGYFYMPYSFFDKYTYDY